MSHAEPGEVRNVQIAECAIRTITREVDAASDGRETGGILLGYVNADATADVRYAGDPGPAAVRTQTFFLRDRAHAQRLADTAFATDGSIWIGEWHTHPSTEPVPSRTDIDTYHNLLADQELHFAVIVSIIIGPLQPLHRPEVGMIAWACTLNSIRTIPIQLTDVADGQGHVSI